MSFTDLVRGPVSIHTQAFGDWILARPDGSPTYNFAVVVDDALMEVTHVIRGEDHLSNTPKQIVLYEALDLPAPQFAHLSMILGPDGSKLSKRHGDVSVDALRAAGFLPDAVINGLSLLGWSDTAGQEIFAPLELVEKFDLARVNKAAAIFDGVKFRHLNREHIKKLSDSDLAQIFAPYLSAANRIPTGECSSEIRDWMGALAALIRDRIEVLSDAVSASDPVFLFDSGQMDEESRASLLEPGALAVVRAFAEKSEATDLAQPGAFKAVAGAVKEALGVKGRALFHPIRVGITAAGSGPDLERLVPLLARGSRLGLPTPVIHPADRARRVLEVMGSA